MRRVTLVAALALSAACAVVAQSWQPLGPDGGPVVSIARDPNVSSRLWISTGRIGVLRSDDGARSWAGVNAGLPTPITTDVVRTAGALLAGTRGNGLFRSSDDGNNWTLVESVPTSAVIESLAVDPRFDSIVYIAISNASAASTLFQSRDAGITSVPLAFPESATRLVVDPLTSRVYAASRSCAYTSSDLGATWTAMPCAGGRGPITDLAPDPGFPGVVFVAAQDYSFFRVRMAGGVFRTSIYEAAIVDVTGSLPTSVNALSFSSDGTLLAGTARGIFATSDGGKTWDSAAFPATGVQRLLAASDGILFAGTSARGLFESTDGGGSWESRSRGIRGALVDAIAIDERIPSTLWVGSADEGGGVSVTRDGGESWNEVAGFPADQAVDALAVDPFDRRRILAGAHLTVFTQFAAGNVYTSDDSGVSWKGTYSLGFNQIRGFAFDPVGAGHVLAGASNGVLASLDAGDSWPLGDGPSEGSTAFDPDDPARAYTARLRSMDRGASWAPLGLPQDPSIFFREIRVGPAGSLYAATSQGIWKSLDHGDSFVPVAGGPSSFVQSLAIDARSSHFYAGLQLAVGSPEQPSLFESRDGETWTAAADRLPNAGVLALAVDATSGIAYAGTLGGLYRRIPADSSCSATAQTLCLGRGRFRVQVVWTTSTDHGSAQTFPLTPDAGAFWFFTANNLELVVKVVDGSAVNAHFWVFAAGLTDVEYDLAITDTATGKVWTHHNDAGTLASFADTSAF